MESWSLLIDIVALLASCLIAGGVASRLGQSPLVGYLLAGMVVGGPDSLNLIRSQEDIETIAELGVSLLLFSLGLEFSWGRVRGLGAKALLCGVAQVVLTGLCAGLGALLFGLGPTEATVIGAMLSLSSTAAVLRVLIDFGEIDSRYGRNSIAVLLVQDMAVVPLAVLMTLLAGGGGTAGEVAAEVGRILLLASLLVVTLFLLLNYVAVKVLGRLTLEQNRELTVLLAVVVGLGSTWAAHAAGLSPALGAFIAGMFLGGSPFATQVRADVSSLRVVLLTLFFGAVGMVADPVWIGANFGFVVGVALLMVAGKTVIVWLILRISGQGDRAAVATGLCLAQVGEFAFVLGSTGREADLISESTYLAILSSAIVTLFLTPYLVSAAPRMGGWIEGMLRRGRPVAQIDAPEGIAAPDIVIIGFGPAGQAIGRALEGGDKRVLVLDLNQTARERAAEMGFDGQIGDAQQVDVLEHAHVGAARIVAITLPSRSAALTVVQHVRRLAPQARIIVRSRYQLHTSEFEAAGAHAVVGDESEVGTKLSERLLDQIAELDSVGGAS